MIAAAAAVLGHAIGVASLVGVAALIRSLRRGEHLRPLELGMFTYAGDRPNSRR